MSEAVFDLSPAAITDAIDRKIEHMREKQPHLTHRGRRALERASRKFGVSTAALDKMRQRQHAKLKAQNIDVGHGNGRLGPFWTLVITVFILVLASQHLPPSRPDIATMLSDHVPAFQPPETNDANKRAKALKATRRWVERHVKKLQAKKIYKVGVPKYLYKNRQADNDSVRDCCERFSDSWGTFINECGQPPAYCVINWDETRLVYHADKIRQERVFWGDNDRPQSKDLQDQCTGSLVSLVAADGARYLDVMCIKADVDKATGLLLLDGIELPLNENALRERRGSVPLLYCFSATGYFQKDQILAIIDKFTELWKLKVGTVGNDANAPAKVWAHLFSDNLAAHKDEQMLLKQLKQGVTMWSLPPNTSHFTQPSDAEPFAMFKVGLRNIANKIVNDAFITGTDAKYFVIRAAHEALAYLTPAVIRAGFTNTHLYPFDQAKYMNHVIKHLTEHTDAANRVFTLHLAKNVSTLINGRVEKAKERVADRADNTMTLAGKVRSSHIISAPQLAKLKVDTAKLRAYEQTRAAVDKAQRELDKKSAKTDAAAQRVCRHPGCGATHKTDKAWLVCACSKFRACPAHKGERKIIDAFLLHKVDDISSDKCSAPLLLNQLYHNDAVLAAERNALDLPCVICGRSADNPEHGDALQCEQCNCWVHCSCAGVLSQQVSPTTRFWCSTKCARASAAPTPARYDKSGIVVPPAERLPMPEPPIDDGRHSLYSKVKFRRWPALADEALKVSAANAAEKESRKRKATPAPTPHKVPPAAAAAAQQPDQVALDLDDDEDDAAFYEDIDIDDAVQSEKEDDEAGPSVDVRRSLSRQFNELALGARLKRRKTSSIVGKVAALSQDLDEDDSQ